MSESTTLWIGTDPEPDERQRITVSREDYNRTDHAVDAARAALTEVEK